LDIDCYHGAVRSRATGSCDSYRVAASTAAAAEQAGSRATVYGGRAETACQSATRGNREGK